MEKKIYIVLLKEGTIDFSKFQFETFNSKAIYKLVRTETQFKVTSNDNQNID